MVMDNPDLKKYEQEARCLYGVARAHSLYSRWKGRCGGRFLKICFMESYCLVTTSVKFVFPTFH